MINLLKCDKYSNCKTNVTFNVTCYLCADNGLNQMIDSCHATDHHSKQLLVIRCQKSAKCET